MLSSAGKAGDGARCRALGVAAYLTKPVSQRQLVSAMRLALGRESEALPNADLITRHSLPARLSPLRILLAEDNAVNQKVAVRMLEKEGHSVTVVANGREAVLAAERQTFDLILMDVQMPEMDGFDATWAIRTQEDGGKRTPIIALTAHAMAGDKERCLDAGMDGYVTKPIRVLDLMAEITRLRGDSALESDAEQLIPAAS
jgi:CheY-like chemotaxis protein